MTVKLGDEVKDLVTGFKGIAVARHSYLNGCDRITVQPPCKKGEPLPEELNFDEPQLVVTKVGKVKIPKASKKTGGPDKHQDTKRPTPRRH